MDLGTVEKKMKSGQYPTPLEFGNDVRLIWKNALTYNPRGTTIYNYTEVLKQFFEKLFHEIEQNPYNENYSNYVQSKARSYGNKMKEFTNKGKSKNNDQKPMSYQEKRALSESIKSKFFVVFLVFFWCFFGYA